MKPSIQKSDLLLVKKSMLLYKCQVQTNTNDIGPMDLRF